MKDRVDTFLAGGIVYGGARSLLEDIAGQQQMIELYQRHWTSGYVTAPIAIVFVAVGLAYLVVACFLDYAVCK